MQHVRRMASGAEDYSSFLLQLNLHARELMYQHSGYANMNMLDIVPKSAFTAMESCLCTVLAGRLCYIQRTAKLLDGSPSITSG